MLPEGEKEGLDLTKGGQFQFLLTLPPLPSFVQWLEVL